MKMAGVRPDAPKKEQQAPQASAASKRGAAFANPKDLGDANAKAYIEQLQAETREMPETRPMQKDVARQKSIVLQIFGARIGIDAASGSRGGKALDEWRNYKAEGEALGAMAENDSLKNWLIARPCGKLRKLILTGHGGEMEKDFKKYLLMEPKIPEKTPNRFLPTAKTRCEALRAQITAARSSKSSKR